MSEVIPTVTNDLDVRSVFADWTEEDWARHQGKILVLSVDPANGTREFLKSVEHRNEFDVNAFVNGNPNAMIQFFELPLPKSIGQDPETVETTDPASEVCDGVEGNAVEG